MKGLTLGAIATIVGILSTAGGGVVWYDNRQTAEHNEMQQEQIAADVELDLQRVELELKLLRTIAERRPLTPDEQDRLEYLRELRTVLLDKQRNG